VPEPPRDEDDEERGQGAVRDDGVRVLEEVGQPVLRRDDDQAPPRVERVEVPQPRAGAVDEQDREREGEHRRIGDLQEAALAAVPDAAGGICQGRVRDQRETELAECEEDRERQRAVAVPQLACEQCEAGRDHERPEPVARLTQPDHEADGEEGPGREHSGTGPRLCRQGTEVLDLDVVSEEAEEPACDDRQRLEIPDSHEQIVT
jgi:hypothetical protein